MSIQHQTGTSIVTLYHPSIRYLEQWEHGAQPNNFESLGDIIQYVWILPIVNHQKGTCHIYENCNLLFFLRVWAGKGRDLQTVNSNLTVSHNFILSSTCSIGQGSRHVVCVKIHTILFISVSFHRHSHAHGPVFYKYIHHPCTYNMPEYYKLKCKLQKIYQVVCKINKCVSQKYLVA